MTAFETTRVNGGGRCTVPRCFNAGRYVFYFAGLPTMGPYGRELICQKHEREWKRLFAELAPSREYMEGLIADIGGKPSARCDAINDLRELGFSQEVVAQAVKGVAERVEVGEILDRMLGAGELEAVA